MATTIVTKSGSGAPAASDLLAGELAVDLTNKRLYTEDGSAAIIELGTNPSGNVTFGDNGKAIFGAGSDLQIYHNGSHSIISDTGTGNLKLGGTGLELMNGALSEYYLAAVENAGVYLYYDNAAKLVTTASGIDVTGSVTTSAGGTFTTAAGNDLNIVYPSGRSLFIKEGSETHVAVDNVGNVGIGTSSPTSRLQLDGAEDRTGGLTLSAGGQNHTYFLSSDFVNVHNIETSSAAAAHTWQTNGAEAMRISSGNLLVGKTASNYATEGIEIRSNEVLITKAGLNPLSVRSSGDGSIISLNTDGTTVGSIGALSSKIYIGSDDTSVFFDSLRDALVPHNGSTNAARDAAIDLGRDVVRYKDLYLSGDIVSSRFSTDGDGIKMEAGKGIKFSGYASGNVLDDYEEGEFTLVLSGTVAAGTNAGGSRGGFYTKIGRLVTCQIMVANTELTNATGVLKFSGLPFTPAGYASRGFRGVVSTYGQNLFSPADGYFSPAIDIVNGSTDFYLIQTKDDGNWANVLVDNQSGLYFEGCVSYFAND